MGFLVKQIFKGNLADKLKSMRKSVSESIAKAVSGTVKKVTAPVTKLLKKLTGREPLTTPQPGKAKSNGKPVDVQVYTDQNGKVWIEWNPRISEDELAEIAKKQKSCKPTKVNPNKVTAVKDDKKKNEKAYQELVKEEQALGESLGGCDLPACPTNKKAGNGGLEGIKGVRTLCCRLIFLRRSIQVHQRVLTPLISPEKGIKAAMWECAF